MTVTPAALTDAASTRTVSTDTAFTNTAFTNTAFAGTAFTDPGRRGSLLVTYLTGGMREDWPDLVAAMVDGGADAVEIGLPFSDPMLEGGTVQEACTTALGRGATAEAVLDRIARIDVPVPLVVMTYANHAYSRGVRTYCRRLGEAGVAGSILCDLPYDESERYAAEAREAGVAPVLMVSPATSEARTEQIARRSGGFLYVMSTMATTGSGTAVGATGWATAERARRLADPLPVLVGFGITDPAGARTAARYGDGVVIGSVLVRQVLDGAAPARIAETVARFRRALDSGSAPLDAASATLDDQPAMLEEN